MIDANDYVGPVTYPNPPDYDGCGYEFSDNYCIGCENYHECKRFVEGDE